MDTTQQTHLRRHLSELRHAAHGIGRDFAIEFETLDDKIARLGSMTAKQAKYALQDIEEDFANLGHSIGSEMRRLPGQVAEGLSNAGSRIESGTIRVAAATRDALEAAGHKTKESTKNAFATLAGVRRTPIKEWEPPSTDSS